MGCDDVPDWFREDRAPFMLDTPESDLRATVKRLIAERDKARARLAGVEAERDSYRDAVKRYDAVHDNLAAENARLRQERDRWCNDYAAIREVVSELHQEVADLRPVVEAAQALIDWYRKMAGAPLHPQLDAFNPLTPTADAVDAYRAGQKAPDDQTDVELGIGAAVRAAAPALRAGALREAAVEINAKSEAEKNVYVMGGLLLAAAMLRERADRIGGAK